MSERGIRRTWMIAGSIITVVMLAFGLVQVLSVLARTTDPVETDASADGIEELVVTVESGSVEIRGTDSDVISLRGSVTSGLRSTPHSEGVRGDRFVVTADCSGGLGSDFCGVDHVIEVPRSMPVTVRSSNTSITVEDIDAAVDVVTSNDSISADGLGGRVELRTSNDSIRATALSSTHARLHSSNDEITAEFLVAPDRVVVTTSNAPVTIVVPDTDDAYDVELDTSNGEQTAAVRTDPTSGRRLEVSSSNDDVVVRYPQD